MEPMVITMAREYASGGSEIAQAVADKLGIPYVWFPADKSVQDASDEVKNIITGDQQTADAQSWEPDTVYAQQTVTVEA